MAKKIVCSLIKLHVLLVCGVAVVSCSDNTGDKPFTNATAFCNYAFDAFKKNDAQRYAKLFRNEQDFIWLKTYLISHIPDAGKNKPMLQKMLDNFDSYKSDMVKRLDEDRIILVRKFTRIFDSGKSVNFKWNDAVLLECKFKSIHTQFGITQGLINMHVSQNGKMYLISNNVFKMGARGYRAMATPRWEGRVK